jgi:hypothetical protein
MKIGPLEIDIRRILFFVGVIVLFALALDFNARLDALNALEQEAELVRARGTAVMVTQAALETRVAYATSEAAVEQWAREQNRMALPGDQPVIPLAAAGATPIPLTLPTPTPTPMTNFAVWMTILFGR